MILGLGTDIVSLPGFKRSYQKRGDLFASQFCTDKELSQLNNVSNKTLHLAKIFCAKECIGKAVGTGLVQEFWWDDIEVQFQGQKVNVLFSKSGFLHFTKLFDEIGNWELQMSLSSSFAIVSGVCIVSTTY